MLDRATRWIFRRMHGQLGVARRRRSFIGVARGQRTARISIGRSALVATRMDVTLRRAIAAKIAFFHRPVRPWNGESLIGPSVSKSGADRPRSQYFPFIRIDDESRHSTEGVDAGGDDPVAEVLQRTHEAISISPQYRRDISSRNAGFGFRFGLGFGSDDRLRGIVAIGRVEALRGRLPRRGERGQCERRREAHPKNKGFRSSPQSFHREFPIIVLPRLSGREVSAQHCGAAWAKAAPSRGASFVFRSTATRHSWRCAGSTAGERGAGAAWPRAFNCALICVSQPRRFASRRSSAASGSKIASAASRCSRCLALSNSASRKCGTIENTSDRASSGCARASPR